LILRSVNVEADGLFSAEVFEGRTYVVKPEAADPRGWWDMTSDQPIPPTATTSVTITLVGDRTDLLLLLVPHRDPTE
jgi:hypothetical protein